MIAHKKKHCFLSKTIALSVACLLLCNNIAYESSFTSPAISAISACNLGIAAGDILGRRDWDTERIRMATGSLLRALIPEGSLLSDVDFREQLEKSHDLLQELDFGPLIPCTYGISPIGENWHMRWWVVDKYSKGPRAYVAKFNKADALEVDVYPEPQIETKPFEAAMVEKELRENISEIMRKNGCENHRIEHARRVIEHMYTLIGRKKNYKILHDRLAQKFKHNESYEDYVESLARLRELYLSLPENEKLALRLAVILHDVMDVPDTKVDHTESGAIKARAILKESGFPQEVIESACEIIGLHGLITTLGEKYFPKEMLQLSPERLTQTQLFGCFDATDKGKVNKLTSKVIGHILHLSDELPSLCNPEYFLRNYRLRCPMTPLYFGIIGMDPMLDEAGVNEILSGWTNDEILINNWGSRIKCIDWMIFNRLFSSDKLAFIKLTRLLGYIAELRKGHEYLKIPTDATLNKRQFEEMPQFIEPLIERLSKLQLEGITLQRVQEELEQHDNKSCFGIPLEIKDDTITLRLGYLKYRREAEILEQAVQRFEQIEDTLFPKLSTVKKRSISELLQRLEKKLDRIFAFNTNKEKIAAEQIFYGDIFNAYKNKYWRSKRKFLQIFREYQILLARSASGEEVSLPDLATHVEENRIELVQAISRIVLFNQLLLRPRYWRVKRSADIVIEKDSESTLYSTPNPAVYSVLRRIDLQKGDVVLDPCAGSGSILSSLAVSPTPGKIIAADIRYGIPEVEGQKTYAIKENLKAINALFDFLPESLRPDMRDVQILQQDITNMGLPDSSIDKILANHPFGRTLRSDAKSGFANEVEAFILFLRSVREFHRALKPGCKSCSLVPKEWARFLNICIASDLTMLSANELFDKFCETTEKAMFYRQQRQDSFNGEYSPEVWNEAKSIMQDIIFNKEMFDLYTEDVENSGSAIVELSKPVANTRMTEKAEDVYYMRKILEIAEKKNSKSNKTVVVAAVVNSEFKKRGGGEIIKKRTIRKNKYGVRNHLEIAALQEAVKKGWDLRKCTLYVSIESCYNCAKAIANNFDIGREVIGNIDPTQKGRGLAVLEKACKDVFIIGDSDLRHKALQIYEEWIRGQKGYESGELTKRNFDDVAKNPRAMLETMLHNPKMHHVNYDYMDMFDWAAYLYFRKTSPFFASKDSAQVYSYNADRFFDGNNRTDAIKAFARELSWGRVRINPKNNRFTIVLVGSRENSLALAEWVIEKKIMPAKNIYIATDLDKNPMNYTETKKEKIIGETLRAAERAHIGLVKKLSQHKTRIIVDEGIFEAGALKKDMTGRLLNGAYIAAGDICQLDKCNTKDVDEVIKMLKKIEHPPESTIVQISSALSPEDIEKLQEEIPEGVRFMRVDTSALNIKYNRDLDPETRWKLRFTLYAMLLAARDITDEDIKLKEANPAYRTLHFFLKTRGVADPHSYIDELARDNIAFLINHYLSFIPTEPWSRETQYHLIGIRYVSGAA